MKLHRNAFFLLCMLSGSIAPAFACQCPPKAPTLDFFESTYYIWEQTRPQSIIIKAKFVGVRNGYGAQLKILRTYYGQPTNPDTITAWANAGPDCREDISQLFQPGDTLILGLMPLVNVSSSEESHDDYYLWSCMLAYLQVKGDSVYGGGPSSFTYPSYPLGKLEDSLRSRVNDIPLGIGPETTHGLSEATLYPNPARASIHLMWNQQFASAVTIAVYDMTGRLVKTIDDGKPYSSGKQDVLFDVRSMVDGNYIVKLSSEGQQQVLRFVVNNSPG